MESWLCIAGGTCLIVGSIFLSRLRPPDWSVDGKFDSHVGQSFARWSMFQRVVRVCNNFLLGITGGLIFLAGFVVHGRTWLALWLVILLLVVFLVLLASLDAFSSMASYRRAIPEAARRLFGEQQDP